MPVYLDNPESIGNTPLIQISRLINGLRERLLAKIEGRNPVYSVKVRIGAAMIWDAEKLGVLKPGQRVAGKSSWMNTCVCSTQGLALCP